MEKKDIVIAIYVFCLFFISSFIITPPAIQSILHVPFYAAPFAKAGVPFVMAITSAQPVMIIILVASITTGGIMLIMYGLCRLRHS
jgi:hypothetical protein